MPNKKFRTLHKFGKKRKRSSKPGKNSEGGECRTSMTSVSDASSPSVNNRGDAIDDGQNDPHPVASTSTAEQPIVASSRKMQYFKSAKRKFDSDSEDDEENDETPEQQNLLPSDNDAETGDSKLNMLVNLGCLQSLISSSKLACPYCKGKVS